MKNIFKTGAISPQFIAESIEKHQSKIKIGAHQTFMGQIRQDQHEEQTVACISYSAQEEMCNVLAEKLREEMITKYDLSCIHIYHSIGRVNVGELCFFVFLSARHRSNTFQAIEECVNRVKAELPIFGKEIYEDESHSWKVNT